MAERIGRARCPLCQSDRAHLSVSKKGLPCLTCNGCKAQLFSRGDNSDTLLRACYLPGDPAGEPIEAAPTPAPINPPAPPAPPAQDEPRRPSWGLFG